MAAHLAGVTAAHTLLPVLGVPIAGSPLSGLDALLATVQMPGGIPVATFAIGKAGAKNAGLFAAAILARRRRRDAQAPRQVPRGAGSRGTGTPAARLARALVDARERGLEVLHTARRFSSVYCRSTNAGWKVGITGMPR